MGEPATVEVGVEIFFSISWLRADKGGGARWSHPPQGLYPTGSRNITLPMSVATHHAET